MSRSIVDVRQVLGPLFGAMPGLVGWADRQHVEHVVGCAPDHLPRLLSEACKALILEAVGRVDPAVFVVASHQGDSRGRTIRVDQGHLMLG